MATRSTEHRQLAAILFTDIVAYVAGAQRDEAEALERLSEHNRLLRTVLPRHHRGNHH
jgi:class 3 adenylate cyclase